MAPEKPQFELPDALILFGYWYSDLLTTCSPGQLETVQLGMPKDERDAQGVITPRTQRRSPQKLPVSEWRRIENVDRDVGCPLCCTLRRVQAVEEVVGGDPAVCRAPGSNVNPRDGSDIMINGGANGHRWISAT